MESFYSEVNSKIDEGVIVMIGMSCYFSGPKVKKARVANKRKQKRGQVVPLPILWFRIVPIPKKQLKRRQAHPLGRHQDLTGRQLRSLMGHNSLWTPLKGPFSGCSKSTHSRVTREQPTGFSVPVTRKDHLPIRKVQFMVIGIPDYVSKSAVYPKMLVFLSRHSMDLLTLNFSSSLGEGRVATLYVKVHPEAEGFLQKHSSGWSATLDDVLEGALMPDFEYSKKQIHFLKVA